MAYDANEHEGRHFLSMEFVDGPNLERHVKKNGPLPLGLACEVIFQAANGLQYAFEKGVVHRDIKPANLLLAMEEGQDAIQVKILDFGLARFHHAEHDDDLGKENSVMGTPDFLSPEQARDLKLTDVRSDLYSLGCTFYYILTGDVPFPGGSNLEKLFRHNQEAARPFEELRPDAPPEIAAIIAKLMAKAPADRYQTPDELMNALAPHAAPSILDWPIIAPQTHERASQEEIVLPDDLQQDTEPRAQSATHVGDEESILEWVDTHSRERRRFRRILLAVAAGAATITLIVAALLAWWLLG
jgi:serine/threonine protein kinase